MQFLLLICLIFSNLNFVKTEKIEESSHPYQPNQYYKVSRKNFLPFTFYFVNYLMSYYATLKVLNLDVWQQSSLRDYRQETVEPSRDRPGFLTYKVGIL